MPTPALAWLDHLKCRRVKGTDAAQAIRLSLPLPRGLSSGIGFAGQQTQCEPVAFWSDGGVPGAPRRELLLATTDGAPESVAVEAQTHGGSPCPEPSATLTVIERDTGTPLSHEVNEMVLGRGGKELGIRVGLLTDEGIHWWQWVRIEELSVGPVCRSVRAMGAVPVHFETEADIPESGGYAAYPWLHKHNHVRGEVFARCFVNGVIEFFIRHINGCFFTEGGDLHGVVPVIGFREPGAQPENCEQDVTGVFRLRLGEVSLDSLEASHLVGDDRPGKLWLEDGVLVYQPYTGIEALAGHIAEVRTGDAYLARADQRKFPKGMARTVRMAASLGDAPPEVAVYIAPDWWYGIAEELTTKPLLPVRDETDAAPQESEDWLNANLYRGSFDDGALTRYGLSGEPGSGDTGWEGEAPYGHLLAAYRSGNPETYDLALRNCYHLADVATDHSFLSVRMHAYEGGAQSLPMQRILGHYAAYLETGDPYLSETAMAVAEHAYWWDRKYWPRRSIGRDAAYIRGLIFLHRYTGEGFYLRRAREAIGRVIQVQHPDGSYADQGGAAGVHGGVNLVVKPWMGSIATEPLVDYLDFCPEDEEVAAAALRFADWLLAHRIEEDGQRHWPYQWSFDGANTYPNLHGKPASLPVGRWHEDYLAKILGWASLKTGNPDYYQAWHESLLGDARRSQWDHRASKVLQNLTALRAMLWGATLCVDGVRISPRPDLTGGQLQARIASPMGELEASADEPGGQLLPLPQPR